MIPLRMGDAGWSLPSQASSTAHDAFPEDGIRGIRQSRRFVSWPTALLFVEPRPAYIRHRHGHPPPGAFCDRHHISNGGFLKGYSVGRMVTGYLILEPAPTIRTPPEMDSLVFIGARNIARIAHLDIPQGPYFHYRSTCDCFAGWTSDALRACQRQPCKLKTRKSWRVSVHP